MSSSKANPQTTRNRERAERRRSVIETVREQRERLASATGNPLAFDHELALTYANNRVSATYAQPLLVVLVAAVAIPWSNWMLILSWAAAVLAVHAIAIMHCRRFSKMSPGSANVRQWRQRFIAFELLGGLAWSALFLITPVSTSMPGLDVFQFAAMLLFVSVTTSLASTIPIAAVAGAVPVTLTLTVLNALQGGVLHIALSVMALCTLIFFTLLSTRLYSSTLAMLAYRAEKDLLIAELGTAKAISDESRRRAEEANLAKSRFLATMSHELRTPLNAILGFSEIIEKEVLGPVGNATYKEYVGDIHESGQYLLNLINEILDLSRIEAERYELTEEPIDLASVLADCHRLMKLKASAKNIAIVEEVQPHLPRLWADERAVRQIVLNLLSNALKFTPSGGTIRLKAARTPQGGQSLTVADNGPGIPEHEIPVVLSSFGQGSIAIESAERGAGLGLPIVQALMSTHDGDFELKSKLREGTEATCIFPPARSMEALAPIRQAS